MKTLIVFDHPYTAAAHDNQPHNRAFTAALCKSLMDKLAAQGQEVDLIDLHADGFNPVMTKEDLKNWRLGIPMDDQVADYQKRVREAHRIVFMFPVWWELMPAMTKGFLDKVYAKDILYTGSGTSMKTTLDSTTEVTVVTVMGTPKGIYRTVFGKPVVKALQRGTFMKTGIKNFKWINFSSVDTKTPEERAQLIESFML